MSPFHVRCPRCRREVLWEGNAWRPFCSERCRLQDLGDWASERYRIPVVEEDDEDGSGPGGGEPR